MALRTFFTAHPEAEGETYWEHFGVAIGFSRQLAGAAAAAAIHAVAPAFFTTTASHRIRCLAECLEAGDRTGLSNAATAKASTAKAA